MSYVSEAERELLVGESPNGNQPSDKPPVIDSKTPIPACAEALTKNYHYAVGGSRLYTYENGCYRPDERILGNQIKTLLGDAWSRRNAAEIVAYLRLGAADLWERPLLNTLNVANGLLDLGTMTLGEHDSQHLSPVQIPVSFDPAATCPDVDQFIDDTAGDLRKLVLEVFGLALVPDTGKEAAIMFRGVGGTGKSATMALLGHLLGQANVSTVSLHALDENRFAAAGLYGKLANIVADLPYKALKASSMFKMIASGDQIPAEYKGKDQFNFRPYARMVFSTNQAPPTADTTDSYYERWLVLPYDQKFRGTAKQIESLADTLATPENLSGLLNLALAGLQRLRANGFSTTERSKQAAEKFRVDSDTTAGHVHERCVREGKVKQAALYEDYRSWCLGNGRQPVSAQHYNNNLRDSADIEVGERTIKGYPWWIGIELKPISVGDDLGEG